MNIELPNHKHGTGETHSHEGGHAGHFHPQTDELPKIGGAEGGQYDQPTAIVKVKRLAGRPIGRTVVTILVKRYVWDSGYLRFVPCKGFDFTYEDRDGETRPEPGTNGNGKVTLLAPYHDVESVEDLT